LLLNALPWRISELSHIATVANDQHVPHVPWTLEGVTAPMSLQSREDEADSFSMNYCALATNVYYFIFSSYYLSANSLIFGGSKREFLPVFAK
jgi:hypothetical protein